MTVYQHPRDEALPAASPVPPERGHWNWQRLVQRSCIVLALLLLVIFVVSLSCANLPEAPHSSRATVGLPVKLSAVQLHPVASNSGTASRCIE